MAIEMTRKKLKHMFKHVFYVKYCVLQTLLNDEEEIGYNSGLYGWNWSAYAIDRDVAINTGYRNLTGAPIPYGKVTKYNRLGKLADEKYWRDCQKKKEVKKKMLNRLIREAIKQEEK